MFLPCKQSSLGNHSSFEYPLLNASLFYKKSTPRKVTCFTLIFKIIYPFAIIKIKYTRNINKITPAFNGFCQNFHLLINLNNFHKFS